MEKPVVSALPLMPEPVLVNDSTKVKAADGATFSLEVQLSGDVLGILKFGINDSIDAICQAFVTEKRLRSIFLAPLAAHAELMVHMDKRVDSVDVIDLI